MKTITKKRLTIIAAFIGLLIFLQLAGWAAPLTGFFSRTVSPVFAELQSWASGIGAVYNEQTDKRDLSARVDMLEAETARLAAENAELRVVQEENAVLRDLLEFFDANEYEHTVSRVISRGDITDVSGRAESIILDKGASDGIKAGQAVVDEEGVVVGKVIAVKPASARACLLNSESCRMAAGILGEESTSGIVSGELGLTVKMELIPQGRRIKAGDLVVSSGLEEEIPRGLAIGRVAEVSQDNNELWQSAVIEPLFRPDKLLIVAVITK